MLQKVLKEEVLDYFDADHWNDFMAILERGSEVRHAHLYLEGILDPRSMAEAARAYFNQRGLPLQRGIRFLSHGPGFANVYNVHPQGMAHFEIFMLYNEDVILEPMRPDKTRKGKSMEYWDDAYMDRFYRGFDFRPLTPDAAEQVRRYFRSDAWKLLYATMAYEERNVHAHAIVETSLHPEELLPLGREAIESKGWSVQKSISVVFSVRGQDVGKLTYLLDRPEIVLELEWEHEPEAIIRPAVHPVARIIPDTVVQQDLGGIQYLGLEPHTIEAITAAWQERAVPQPA